MGIIDQIVRHRSEQGRKSMYVEAWDVEIFYDSLRPLDVDRAKATARVLTGGQGVEISDMGFAVGIVVEMAKDRDGNKLLSAADAERLFKEGDAVVVQMVANRLQMTMARQVLEKKPPTELTSTASSVPSPSEPASPPASCDVSGSTISS